MKKSIGLFICLCLVATFLFAVSVSAETYGDLTYSVSGAEVTITGCKTSASGAMVIPDTINGYPVTKIGAQAFYFCTGLTSVEIPASVRNVGYNAFYSCSKLSGVYISDLAAWCSIEFENIYANPLYVAYKLYLSGQLVTDLVIPSTVTRIGSYAFVSARCITSITIPTSVNSIGTAPFADTRATAIQVAGDNPYFTSVDGVLFSKYGTRLICFPSGEGGAYTIPSGVLKISDLAFAATNYLTAIHVAADNPAFSSKDGVLFNKNKTKLIRCPAGRSGAYTVPESVTAIGDEAFRGCTKITSIQISNKVKSIGSWAFFNCYAMTSINIPKGITSIGDSTFRGCSSLKSITIPSSVTSIGAWAFRGCSSLITITIPSSVTSIKEYTFFGCKNLSSVIIPSSVTSIEGRAFQSCSSLTQVFYTGTSSEWSKINIGANNNPLLKAKYYYSYILLENSSFYKTITVYQKTNGKPLLCEGATVYFEYAVSPNYILPSLINYEQYVSVINKGGKTNQCGQVVFPEMLFRGIRVVKDGFYEVEMTTDELKSANYTVVLSASKPDIKACYLDGSNLLKTEVAVDPLQSEAVTLTAEVDWHDSSRSALYLMQKQHRVDFETQGVQSGDFHSYTLTTVLRNDFDVSETIYLVAEAANGETSKVKLKLTSYEGRFKDVKFDFGSSIKATVPSSWPVIGGAEVGIDVPPYLPITVTIEENRFKVVIGADVRKLEEKYKYTLDKDGWHSTWSSSNTGYFDNFKDNIKKCRDKWSAADLKKKWKDAFTSLNGSFGFEADFTVLGFAEGYFKNGKPVFLDSGVIFNPSIKWSCSKQLPVSFPVYFEAEIKAEIMATINIFLLEEARSFKPNATIEGEIELRAGLGVGVAKAIGVSGGVQGGLKATWDACRDRPDYFALSGHIGAYVKIFAGPFTLFKKDWNFVEGIICDYPSTRVETMGVTGSLSKMMAEEKDDFVLIERDYTESPTLFTANESPRRLLRAALPQSRTTKTLKTNIYPYAEVQTVTFDNGDRLIVWTDDNAKRSAINRTSLYYSYCSGGVWSEPAEVEADGTADYSPRLTRIGDAAYLAWVDSSRVLSDTDDLETALSVWEISVAKFEDGAFADVTTITSDGYTDMLPVVFGDGENKYVAWVQNTANDIYTEENAYAVFYRALDGDTVVTVDTGLYAVDSLDATYNGGVSVAYAARTSGSFEDDTNLEVYQNGSSLTQNETTDSGVCFADGVLYWYANDALAAYAGEEVEILPISLSTDRFRVLADAQSIDVLFTGSDGYYTEVYMYSYDRDTETWSEKIALTATGNAVQTFSATLGQNGVMEVLLTVAQVLDEPEDGDPFGATDLCLCTLTPNIDLAVTDVYYEAEYLPTSKTVDITVTVENHGEALVNAYAVTLCAADGTAISTQSIETPLPAGAVQDVTMTIGALTSVGDMTAKVAVSDGEVNESDNEYAFTLSYENLGINSCFYDLNAAGDAFVHGSIENKGLSASAPTTLTLHKDSADGEVVDSLTVGALQAGETAPFAFSVPRDAWSVYVLVLDSEDDLLADNTAFAISDWGAEDSGEDGNIGIDGDALPEESTVTAVEEGSVTSGDAFDAIAARAVDKTFEMHSVTYTGAEALDCTADFSLAIPEGMRLGDIKVYRIAGDYITDMDAEIGNDARLHFTADHLDSYVICEGELVKYGDATGDGKITLTDSLRLFRNMVDDSVSMDIAAADFSGDEQITLIDALMILRCALNQ
ncbi:MAG: leucine-rich repeat protein [Clostridia bacterium]|nr:leucine-rich repeat protein [Clostridia bacterium]